MTYEARNGCWMLVLLAAWFSMSWALWLSPMTEPAAAALFQGLNSQPIEAKYQGIFGWKRIADGHTRPLRLMITQIIWSTATLWMLFAAGRMFWNMSPRHLCRHCAFDMSDSAEDEAVFCPRCHKLPNEQLNPIAFWQTRHLTPHEQNVRWMLFLVIVWVGMTIVVGLSLLRETSIGVIGLVIWALLTPWMAFAYGRADRNLSREQRCRHCGYDVSGTNSRICPECGRRAHAYLKPWAFWRK